MLRSKPTLRRLVLLAFSTMLSLTLLEALCTALAWKQYGTIDVVELNGASIGNVYVADNASPFVKMLMPHPYLGWAMNHSGAGNNVGLHCEDYPLEHDDNFFTVLVTGGSVADNLCMSHTLEKALAELDFGKPVRVLNGSNGGWKQPQQAIAVLLYGEIADAIISVDGFNERVAFQGFGKRLEYPYMNYLQLNPLLNGGAERLAALYEVQRLREYSKAHNSRAVFYATSFLRNRIVAGIDEEQEELLPPTFETIFALPKEWDGERRINFNLAQYKKYIRSIDALAALHGAKVCHFIQPCPAIGKKLTEEEKAVVGPLDYGKAYQRMTDELLALNSETTPVVSMLDLFNDSTETLYIDPVHHGRDNVGYGKISHRVADELATRWQIKKKPPAE